MSARSNPIVEFLGMASCGLHGSLFGCLAIVLTWTFVPNSAGAGSLDDLNAAAEAFKAGDYVTSIGFITVAIEAGDLGPVELSVAFFNRSRALAAVGARSAAIDDLDRSLAIEPNNPAALFQRGNAFSAIGRYEAAIADLSAGLEFMPNIAAPHASRGLAYHALGNLDRAIADFEIAARLEPMNATFASFLARLEASLPPPPANAVAGGSWTHRQISAPFIVFSGEMRFSQDDGDEGGVIAPPRIGNALDRIFARFDSGTSSQRSLGRLEGTISDQVLRGTWFWSQFGGNGCAATVGEANYWGRFEITFDASFETFDGRYGICNGPLDRRWTGQKNHSAGLAG